MLQPKCEICGQPAVIHETAGEAGRAINRHFCQEHRRAAAPAVHLGPQAAQAAEEQYRNLSDAGAVTFKDAFRQCWGRQDFLGHSFAALNGCLGRGGSCRHAGQAEAIVGRRAWPGRVKEVVCVASARQFISKPGRPGDELRASKVAGKPNRNPAGKRIGGPRGAMREFEPLWQ
jgi:hypothetical protein